MAIDNDLRDRPVGELLRQLSQETTTLVKQEIDLAKAEMTEKGKQAGIGAGMFGGAGILGFYAVGALVATAILALALVMAAWLAALLVGVALLVIALVAALIGKSQVSKATPPVPEQAAASVKNDIAAVKEGVHR